MIVMAMAAIGFQTNLKQLITKGGSALLVGGVCWFINQSCFSSHAKAIRTLVKDI